MSGGSLGYLYAVDGIELCSRMEHLKRVEKVLREHGHESAAIRVADLCTDIFSTMLRNDAALFELRDVFHAAEWFLSCDYGADQLAEAVGEWQQKRAKREA